MNVEHALEAELLSKNKTILRKRPIQNTKIVATVGPACSSPAKLLELVKAGVDVFRLNFSHGSHEDHKQVIESIVAINEKYNLHISILADLQGPKLRVGKIEGQGIKLEPGEIITLVNENVIGTKEKIYMSYEQFAQDCEVGERILMDDGKLVFQVAETNKIDTVKLKVLFGGILSSNKGVNLPDTDVSLPSLTEKDMADLNFILTQPVNWIALSFVRKPEDVKELRKLVDAAGHSAKIMSKIEKPEAIKNLKKILKASNAIMVARGDLGVEMPIERLPMLQKKIVSMCMQYARPVVVATQMMDSMVTNPSPTRAEITDVANAVLDGADAVMLSAETSVGAHPALVVEAMTKIIEEAEKNYWPQIVAKRPYISKKSNMYVSDVVCFSAAKLAEDLEAKGIVGMTSSGYTAFKLSSYRPNCPIYIFSEQPEKLKIFTLIWGVQCFYYDRFTSTDETIEDCNHILKASGKVKTGDLVVNSGSMPLHKRLTTNMAKVTIIE